MGRSGDIVRTVSAYCGVALTVFGAPTFLIVAVGNPIAALSGDQGMGTTRDVLATTASVAGWLAWLHLMLILVSEFISAVRGIGLPYPIPLASHRQRELVRGLLIPLLVGSKPSDGLTPIPIQAPAASRASQSRAPRWSNAATTLAADYPRPAMAIASSSPHSFGDPLLCAGLSGALVALRARRAQHRRCGDPIPRHDPEASHIYAHIRRKADSELAQFVNASLRCLTRSLAEQQHAIPQIFGARVHHAALELLLAVPSDHAPLPFVVADEGSRWVLSRRVPLVGLDDEVPALPALAPFGHDGAFEFLVDLESARGPVCIGGDRDKARSLVASVALGLATSPWLHSGQITMIGFGTQLASLTPRLSCVDALTDAWSDLVERLSASRGLLSSSGFDSALDRRIYSSAVGEPPLEVLAFASPPNGEQLAELMEWAHAFRRAPLAILIAGDAPGAAWRCWVDGDGNVRIDPPGFRTRAHYWSAQTHAAFARAVAAEVAVTRPGSWDERLPVSKVRQEHEHSAQIVAATPGAITAGLKLNSLLVRGIDINRENGLQLSILGRPSAIGVPIDDDDIELELVLYLAIHGRVTVADLAQALWPAGLSRAECDEMISRAVKRLGRDTQEIDRLQFDGAHVWLTDDVYLDWHLFVAFSRRGADEDFFRAFDLVRGQLAFGHSGDRYCWLIQHGIDLIVPAYITDVAHRWALNCMARDDPAAAVHALRAGLRCEPQAIQLWDDLALAMQRLGAKSRLAHIAAERAAIFRPSVNSGHATGRPDPREARMNPHAKAGGP